MAAVSLKLLTTAVGADTNGSTMANILIRMKNDDSKETSKAKNNLIKSVNCKTCLRVFLSTVCLRVSWISSKGNDLDTILVDLFDHKVWLRHEKSYVYFVDALVDNFEGIFLRHTGRAILIKDGRNKVLRVPLCSMFYLVHGSHIVQIVQGSSSLVIVSSQQNIDLEGTLSKSSSKFSTGKVSLSLCGKLGSII
jgi:hypothetical protein